MAVDGRCLQSSIYQGSDYYCEFPCSPCTQEGKSVSAIKHCVDCDENLCSSCLKHHNKFSSMRGHQMLNQVQSSSGMSPLLPKKRCAKHGGKVIDVYCPGHDAVCCSTCIAVEHSTCNGISFIPDVAKKIGTTSELQQFESKMSSLKSRCMSLSLSKDANIQTLEQDKIRLLKEIRDFRKKIDEHFDKMERNIVDEVDAKFKQKVKTINDERKEIQNILENLRKTDQRLQEAKQENTSELFVLLKSESAITNRIFSILDKIEFAGNINGLKLTVEKRVETMMNEGYGIGEVEECYQNIVSSFHGEYDIKAKNDVKICLISGICLCQGHTFLTDFSNTRLKKLDNDYKLISHLNLTDGPFGVCNVENTQLAVTLTNKKVQFVSFTEPMQLQTSFNVRDQCRGIEYNKSLLFLCCGGYKGTNEGPGHIEVYSIDGMLMRSFFTMTGIPRSLSVSPDGKYIYVTYLGEDHLVIYGTYGDLVQHCQSEEIKGGSGICRLSSKLLCITGRDSHNIAVITNDGVLQQLIETRKDGIKDPIAIGFDENTSRLIASSRNSANVKVFQLNI